MLWKEPSLAIVEGVVFPRGTALGKISARGSAFAGRTTGSLPVQQLRRLFKSDRTLACNLETVHLIQTMMIVKVRLDFFCSLFLVSRALSPVPDAKKTGRQTRKAKMVGLSTGPNSTLQISTPIVTFR